MQISKFEFSRGKQLRDFASFYDWSVNLDSLRKKSFEALVVTDTYQTIRWVSHGFEFMTGYLLMEVVNL